MKTNDKYDTRSCCLWVRTVHTCRSHECHEYRNWVPRKRMAFFESDQSKKSRRTRYHLLGHLGPQNGALSKAHHVARSWPGPFHSFAYGTQHHAHHGHNVIGGRWDAGPWNWSTFPLQPALNLHCIKADVRKASRCQTNVSCLGFGEDRLTSAIVEGSANCTLTVKAQTCSTRMRPFGYLRHGCMSCNGR